MFQYLQYFCNNTILYCATTDSIINNYYALFVINVVIEFDSWMTLNTLCNIGQ